MDGWIILDKPSGIFSRTAGRRVANMFATKKFGHIGTLDPMASGVLPIAIGAATKMIPFVEDAHPAVKEYLFSLQFGFETDTLDITGHEIARNEIVPDVDTVMGAITSLCGEIEQTPPLYSAVHVDGHRAYELARRGQAVEISPRRVTVYRLDFLGRDGPVWNFRTRCSRGTYVRSLARDIAAKCSTIATVTMIRRCVSGGFDVGLAQKLDFLENMFNNTGDINKYLMPIDYGLGDIPVCKLSGKDADVYCNGGFVDMTGDGMRRVYNGDKFIGIGLIYDGMLHPKRTI